LRVLVILTCCAFASATITYNAASFCQRYGAALFPTDAASFGQNKLIAAVLDRALFGNTTVTPSVTGILNLESQKPFFNGSRGTGTNYYNDAVARAGLRLKLIGFFACALGCRDNCTGLAFPAGLNNMNTVHSVMNIGKTVWDDFIGQFANSMYSFGVPSTAGETGDTAYVLANMGQFLKGAPSSGIVGAICTASDCVAYNTFAEFTSGTDDTGGLTPPNSLRWLNSAGTSTVSIAVGGSVHWNIGSAHFVVETDSSYNAKSGGFSSSTAAGGPATYTHVFPTQGTFYFYCGVTAHSPYMRGTIVVGTAPSAAGTTVPTVAVVLAAMLAGLALRRRI